ncbi:hypothetical protein [Azomonas macrocytogenes]|uniref:Uncharacterized protein n=1 Tax=Azomonas macrocytogenes TaxID=69962 RepID=A0A839T9B5_AZOMA|nr:hypothetical protein [Azomonas macrocytogenes]MBB3105056.1 hypothetical protein [Azomonas macrocytogenes]
MNLYEFSQVNNNEMGVFLSRESDGETYREAYEEAQRLIRVSDEVRIAMEKVARDDSPSQAHDDQPSDLSSTPGQMAKLTTAKFAAAWGIKTAELTERLVAAGLLELKGQLLYLTDKGKEVGGEFRKGASGFYFLWLANLQLETGV